LDVSLWHSPGILHDTTKKIQKKSKATQVKRRELTLKANDTFMTIVQTAKKLGISAYQYICGRVGTHLRCHLWLNSSEKKAH
jgi:hypothetical protein